MRRWGWAMTIVLASAFAGAEQAPAQRVSLVPSLGDGTSLPVELVEGRAGVMAARNEPDVADAQRGRLPSSAAAAAKRPTGARPVTSPGGSDGQPRRQTATSAGGNCGDKAGSNVAAARALVARIASEEGADAKLADAVAAQESHFEQSQVSPKGAIGVMQLMPDTAQRYKVDPCDVEQNIRGGIRYLRDLSSEFGGNILLVLAAYNAGPDRVYAAKGVPPIAETVRYVAAVSNDYYGFENSLSAADAKRSVPNGGAPTLPSDPPTKVAEADTGNRWIGGSVLYVEQEGAGK
ncbi:Transglycosylase SLT domain-containing protein [Rhizobiales bacterium GAS191]|nr:Transglycosylase SLT domain-containing protein [Rhizobiales bacterium GAS191]